MTKMMQRVLSSNHHKNVLSEMLKFLKFEHLTDVTFLCSESKPVFAHRKVLVQISPLLKKVVNSRPKEERLNVVVDVSWKIEKLLCIGSAKTDPFRVTQIHFNSFTFIILFS